MKVFLALSLLGILWFAEAGVLTSSTWAVLVAGSNEWWNYRHQADICQAYHVLINSGVRPERIIVFMYDDIANHPENKNPGQIFNRPGGPDVYNGVKIDYRGKDVNAVNFKNVLLGNKEVLKGVGTGRVIESGPDDVVFINFAHLGAEGLITFPDDTLAADDLKTLFEEMRQKRKFGQMVVFIDGCEAGTIFYSHSDNILASTASAGDESSWAWYCDGYNCLGDSFSIIWLERLEKLNSSESLFENFDAVRSASIHRGHINLYGDYRLGFMEFGNSKNKMAATVDEEKKHKNLGVRSWNVPIFIAEQQVKEASPEDQPEKESKLEKLRKGREYASNLIASIFKRFANGDDQLRRELLYSRFLLTDDHMFPCYKSLVTSFDSDCYKVTKHTYFLQHLRKFGNICVKGLNVNDAKNAIKEECKQKSAEFELII